jgi:hypothetical protein
MLHFVLKWKDISVKDDFLSIISFSCKGVIHSLGIVSLDWGFLRYSVCEEGLDVRPNIHSYTESVKRHFGAGPQ